MLRSISLGRPFGIGTYIHWSFWLLYLYFALQYLQYGFGAVLNVTIFLAAIFGCVLLHEFGHALTARRFGIRTRDIYLYPIGGVARLERMPENPKEEFLIAIAGPAVNVAIAAVLFGLLGFEKAIDYGLSIVTGAAQSAEPDRPGQVAALGGFLNQLAMINLFLVVFNLMPAFPMDGGRVLRALLGFRRGYLQATETAATVGKYMALLMGLYGIAQGEFFLVVIAFFIYISGQQELWMVRLKYGAAFNPRVSPFVDVIDVTPRGER